MFNPLLRTAAILCSALLPCCTVFAASSDLANPEIAKTNTECLPTKIEGLETAMFTDAQRAAAKADRNTELAGYTATPYKLTATAFIYDRKTQTEEADIKELNLAAADILTFRPNAIALGDGTGTLPLAGHITDAFIAVFSWAESDGDHWSFLWVIPKKEHYVKFRITYIHPANDTGDSTKFARDITYKIANATCDL